MSKPLILDYYSDVLCVWAWIAQRRIEELEQNFGDDVVIRHHYLDLFGDVPGKIARSWDERGGYTAFAEHVQHSVSLFEEIPVNASLWQTVRPVTSGNAHLALKAIEVAFDTKTSIDMALTIRKAFFLDCFDIGDLDQLCELIGEAGLDKDILIRCLRSGKAMAALSADHHKAREQGIKGSPSYVLDGGRQVLYGNVGYRVLQANIEELLRQPEDEASWC